MLLLSRNLGARLKPLIVQTLIGAGLIGSQAALGAEWSTEANIYQFFGYDDNVLMRPSTDPRGRIGSFQYKILPTLNFSHTTNVSRIHGHASYGTQVFTDIPQFDQDIQNYGLDGMYQTERINWGLNFNYSITPVRNNAIELSGDFATPADRTAWVVSPMMTYKLSEMDSLILSMSYSESSYQNTATAANLSNNFYRNNLNKSVNLGWQRLWTERYNTSLNVFYSNFEFESGNNSLIDLGNGILVRPVAANGFFRSNNSYGLNFANNYRWSDNWNLTGSVGFRHLDSSGGSGSSGFLANLGAHYTGLNYNAGLTFSRSLAPSNFGQLQELTSTSLHFTYKFHERLSAGLDVSYQDSMVVNAANSLDRENIVVHPSLNWALARDWSLNASYRYRTQDRTVANINQQPFSADSNFFLFSVNYKWPGLKLSK